MKKLNLYLACSMAILSITLGAFGAHGLEKLLSITMQKTFETAAKYQMYHAFALALVGFLQINHSNKQLKIAGYFFILGIILFSGSLYLLSFLSINNGLQYNWLGAVTPFGGICFVLGWLFLAIAISKTEQ
jgi:uncharacterized membrane protein YgdD (TMEM256/DUF423 family)